MAKVHRQRITQKSTLELYDLDSSFSCRCLIQKQIKRHTRVNRKNKTEKIIHDVIGIYMVRVPILLVRYLRINTKLESWMGLKRKLRRRNPLFIVTFF